MKGLATAAATPLSCLKKANGTPCNDGNACTKSDTCQAGKCVGALRVKCVAQDQCHVAGVCDIKSGLCSNPAKLNGLACNDSNACTKSDTCQAGKCVGASPLKCVAQDQCHAPGVCDSKSGLCSNPAKLNGVACNDGNACTQLDTCKAGICVGALPVTCVAQDQCHVPGVCDSKSGLCSNPAKQNGLACNDGNACTQSDTCQAGICVGALPVTCVAQDQCHVPGVCNSESGECSNPAKLNGLPCNDGNACSVSDTCQAGECIGSGPVECLPKDECHVAGECSLNMGLCSDGPIKPDGAACGTNRSCQQGVCAPKGASHLGHGCPCNWLVMLTAVQASKVQLAHHMVHLEPC